MLTNSSIIGFVPVSDFKTAEAFYSGKLGLTVLDRDNPYALVLAMADGTMVRCPLSQGQVIPQQGTILGWEVEDIQASAKDLAAAGIEPVLYPYFQHAEDGVVTFPGGDQVLWFKDPDGNTLSISQHVGR